VEPLYLHHAVREQGTSTKSLEQPHLYLRLPTQHGGETDLQSVVSSYSVWGEVHATYGLDF
jgi:hypothetical protein